MGFVVCGSGRKYSVVGEVRNADKILIEICEGKRPFGRYNHRLEDNIKINVKEVISVPMRTGGNCHKIGFSGGFFRTRS
jgi:hypothetical protein